MNSDITISLQELRLDPVGFLKKIKDGKTVTVIYHSKPYITLKSTDSVPQKSPKKLLEYGALARASASGSIPKDADLKQIYYEGMAKKYGIS